MGEGLLPQLGAHWVEGFKPKDKVKDDFIVFDLSVSDDHHSQVRNVEPKVGGLVWKPTISSAFQKLTWRPWQSGQSVPRGCHNPGQSEWEVTEIAFKDHEPALEAWDPHNHAS